MIALPFHPSNAFTIRELLAHPQEILAEVEAAGRKLRGDDKFTLTDKIRDGALYVDQGVIAGCAGGMYENIAEAYEILKGGSTGAGEFSLSVYPSSQPVYKALVDNGYIGGLMDAGVVVKTAFCGPCFGAGDVPANNGLSIRHTTRNFESREGSKPAQGQLAAVALMDARSIAATAANGGRLTPATEVEYTKKIKKYFFDGEIYRKRVYHGAGDAHPEAELKYGPNIADWPEMIPLGQECAHQGGQRHHRSRHDHGRAHPLGRDFVLSLQPDEAGGICAFAQGSRLCRQGESGQGGRGRAPRDGRTPGKRPARSRAAAYPPRRARSTAAASWRSSRATVPRASRRRPASACWAASPTSRRNMRPSAIAAT